MTSGQYSLHGAIIRTRSPAGLYEDHFRSKYRHPARKASFFLAREGWSATRAKYGSKRLERLVERDLRVIVSCAPFADGTIVGVTRDLGGEPRFDLACLLYAPERLAPDDIRFDDAAMTAAESYLPVSSCPLGGVLADALRQSNSGLRPLSDAALQQALRDGPLRPNEGPRPKSRPASPSSEQRVFFVGFGGYVREVVLPFFSDRVGGALDHRAELFRRHGTWPFPVTSDASWLFDQVRQGEPLVIIASYHSDHVAQAREVLAANGRARVFIEKPAGVTPSDAAELERLRQAGAWIDIGYNRRYAPFTVLSRALLRQRRGPVTVSVSVKENSIPLSHWYFWPNQGTRVTGNMCHWIDLATHLVGSSSAAVEGAGTPDRCALTLAFEDGSVAALAASDDGDQLRGVQEQIELRRGDLTIRIDDFLRCTVLTDGRRRVHRRLRRSKGHAEMYDQLKQRWLGGDSPAYPAADIASVQHLVAAAVSCLDNVPVSGE